MKLLFAYKRLDDQYGVCLVDDSTAVYQQIQCAQKIIIDSDKDFKLSCVKSLEPWKCSDRYNCYCEYSCNDVEYFQKDGEAWVRLQQPDTKLVVEMSLHLFNNGLVCVDNSVTIRNVTEYINCIEHIRLVSLAEHIIALLQYDLSQGESGAKKATVERYIKQLQENIKAENYTLLHSKAALSGYRAVSENCAILITIADIVANAKESKLSDSTISEIKRSRSRYDLGAVFGYYRGIGHTIYPDIPSAFREQYKREEDRWYREMKTQFQNDLEKKPYLDRLGMLQHYELPTRMLDVTSSPLVALYMTSNTIYTGDAQQMDVGEVVMYYDGIVDQQANVDNKPTESLDSYGSDIAYIHDGKSYDSSIVLVLAALAKLKYENKERMRRVISTLKYLIDLKWKNDPKKYASMMELINRCIHANANGYEKRYIFTSDELNSLRKSYSCLRKRKIKSAEEICDILWDAANPPSSANVAKDIITDKDELRKEYLNCIPSYRYILSTVRRENSAFKDHINIFDLVKCFHVKTGRTNERIQAQAGSFIICGLDPDYIKNHMLSSRSPNMVRFFVSNKKEIMRELNSLGINDATMLPDMAHYAAYLKSRTKQP